MWTIDKEFHFEMGHRVWSQKLSHQHLSISTDCACKHLHGHSYAIKVFLTSENLDDSSMVTDFKNLNFMKEFVDGSLDHKFMIDINDPNFRIITSVTSQKHEYILDLFRKDSMSGCNLGGLMFDIKLSEDLQLHMNSFVLVDFVPTSENICKFLATYAQEKLAGVAVVSAVELWETKKSHCRFEP